jgi:hypothetical protein
MIVGLVGCGKGKLTRPAPAKDLYTGPLFKLCRAYVEKFCDAWGILSAKYHFVLPDEVLEPYDRTLKQLDKDYLKQWQIHANTKIMEKLPWEFYMGTSGYQEMRGITFVCLAGEAYEIALKWPRKYTVTYPLRGMGVGKRLKWLNDQLKAPVSDTPQATLF